MPKLKTILRILRQAAVILLITFALAELAFRIYARINPTSVFSGNSYNRFRGKPRSYHYDFPLNSKGFKDVEFKLHKDEGVFRILGIGDSFAYGIVPYQDNYLTLLEQNLNQSGQRVELINMGIGGIGPKDYLSLLLKEGLELKPDMVIVSFFIGNDFSDPTVETDERDLYSYSYVATFIKHLIDINTKYKERGGVGSFVFYDVYKDNESTFDDDHFFKLETGRSEIYKKQSSLFESQFAEAVGYLKEIKQICDERKIALAVALIPDEVQVNKKLQAKVLQIKTFNASPNDFDFALPNRLLAARLQEEGIKCLDLLEAFAAASNRMSLYKPNDTHWNIAGNKLAAELMQKEFFSRPFVQGTSAAIQSASPVANPSSYEGFHEATDCRSINGWAWDARRPNEPVKVEIYLDDSLIATLEASDFRKDLLRAHKGNGAHAFDYPVPVQIKDGKPHTIRVKVAGGDFDLINTPKQIDCKSG